MEDYTDTPIYEYGVALKELGEALMCEHSSVKVLAEKAEKAGLIFHVGLVESQKPENDD